MSQQGGDNQSQLGNFMWASQLLSLSNSDNSGGGSEQRSDKQLLKSGSNSPDGLVGEKRVRNVVMEMKGSSSKDGGGGGGGESDHETHIWTERERRKKMRSMFSNLHALLPRLPPKADKSTIVDESVKYIKSLQQILQNLQKEKLDRMQSMSATFSDPTSSMALQSQGLADTRESFLAEQGKNWSTCTHNPNGTLVNCSSSVSIPRFSGSFQIWSSANVVLSVNGEDAQLTICTTKKPGFLSTIFYVMEKHKLEVISATVSSDCFRTMYMIHAHASGVSDQFPEALTTDQIFKLAVGELLLWLPS